MKRSEWARRTERAERLAGRLAYAAEILTLYAEVLKLQGSIYDEVAPRTAGAAQPEIEFRQRLGARDAMRHLPALLALAEEKGTAKLAEDAGRIRALADEQQLEILEAFLSGEMPEAFFPRAIMQPYAEALAQSLPAATPQTTPSVCPRCNGRPQAAVLRPEGEGGKRFLVCWFCLTEWEFRRILCPVCGEEDYRKLPRYSVEDELAVRVEACDSCHFYLKSIDMTVDGLAVPVVDEVASVPLDLWAAEHGYKKVVPNLMGF